MWLIGIPPVMTLTNIVITMTQTAMTKEIVKLVGLDRAERDKIMLARFSECMKRHTVGQTPETTVPQFVLLHLHFLHSPWSINSQSVKTHLLNFCFDLSLQRKEREKNDKLNFFFNLLSHKKCQLKLGTFTLRYRKLLFASAPLEDMRWNCEQPPDFESSADLTTKSWSTRTKPSWRNKQKQVFRL